MKRVMRNFIIILLVAISFYAFGQNVSLKQEEVESLKQLSSSYKKWNLFLSIWAILGPILGAIITWLGIKNLIEKWAEKKITEKASEKFGLDWNTVKSLVDERQKLYKVRSECPVAIVSKTTGKRKELHELLTSHGFSEPVSYTYASFKKDFQPNSCKIILIDNENEGDEFSEEDVEKNIIEPYKEALYFIWYTKNDVSIFKKFKGCVNFVKKKNHLVENIDDFII